MRQSLILVHADTQNVVINNSIIVNDGSGANLPMNFEVDGVQTDITSFNWVVGNTYIITQLVTTFNDQFQLVPNGFNYGEYGADFSAGDTLSYTVTSDQYQSISFTPDVMVGVYVVTNGVGSVSPSGFQWVDLGANADNGNQVQITATPTSQNQVFEGWTITDVNGAGNTLDDSSAISTVANIWDYATITAQFSEQIIQSTPVQISNVQVPTVATQTDFTIPVSVTVTNPDAAPETANIQVSMGSTSVFSTTVTLNAQQTETVPCDFSTNGLAIGSYTYTVTVTTTSMTGAPTSTTTGQTGITYLGDLTGAFTVNFNDIITFASEYIAFNTNGVCNPAIDYNHDGTINFYDIVQFVAIYQNYAQLNT